MPEETAAAAESMEEKPCSSRAADSSVDVSEEAKKLIGTGNRHLVMGDVVSAVSVFQEACAMLAERYGDTADECGEAFFLCGKALLELARMENTVLGNALEGVPEESSEEEKTRDELRAQVYDAMSEDKTQSEVEKEVGEGEQKNQEEVKEKQEKVEAPKEGDAASQKTEKPAEHEAKPAENENLAEHEAKPAQDEEKQAEHEVKPAEKSEGVDKSASIKEDVTVSNGVAEKDEKVEEKNGNEEKEEPMEEGGGDDDDEDDDDDDSEGETKDKESEEDEVGNLQLAWEMLEVAKVIYKRKDREEDQLMAAQIYLKLGEVGAESGNYSQALDDFNECLTLQLKHLPSHSRLLAETHYQLGTTYSYTAQYSQAIEHFSNSIKVIESRLAMLQEVIDKAEGAEAAKEKSELEELKQLLPEITEKIEDAKEGQRTAAAASEAIHQTLAGASTSSAFPAENGGPSSSTASQIPVRPADGASSSKSASDISHLVRKKRKPDEESPKKDSDAKKTKQETSVNGSGDSAHNGNGVQEKMEQEPASSSSVEMSA
ncbi:histone-binding protein N1/N2-like isoform X2 [Sinocyclocheilus grahami]|uniref:histone-binding protein N1/N2-like isoform X2 n=1 Tax=Sinocyclocheilus grahami TaxID=75366 RepID=UPI0007AC5B89|nr:PREDICTED: histone-binding protein N1/N2-like isoform X2 [Sinocyclocheilus grahami]